MPTVDVRTVGGDTDGSVDLPAHVFDVQANLPLMHQVVVAQQAAARQGTHSTKTRGDVRGGGKKPYRQKGTGRARQGSTRAPQFAGGGVVHGPQPRSYDQRTPKKMKAAALRGALSDRARADRVHVIDSFGIDGAPSTKAAAAALAAITDRRRVLVVLDREDELSWKSLRNVQDVHLIEQGQLNTYDVLVSDDIVFTRAALEAFVSRTTGGHPNPDLSTPDIPGEPVPSVAPAAGEGTVDTVATPAGTGATAAGAVAQPAADEVEADDVEDDE
jgi:large subunit ribosomal protein L4